MLITFLIVFAVTLAGLSWIAGCMWLFFYEETWSMILAVVLLCAGIALIVTLAGNEQRETRITVDYDYPTTTTLG